MTISIWWLIALSQFTLGAVIAAVFFAAASKLAKRKIVDLKHMVNQTIVDYQTLANSIDINPTSSSQENPNQSAETAIKTSCYENTLSLHHKGLESIPTWSADTNTPDPHDHSQLRTTVELYITNLLLKDNSIEATSYWHQFFDRHLEHLDIQLHVQQAQSNALDESKTLWSEKKPQVKDAFDTLVTYSQKTDNTSQIHEALNRLYNDFISVINTVPGIEEITQDALLKMESVFSTDESHTADFNTLVEQADLMQDAHNTMPALEELEIDNFEDVLHTAPVNQDIPVPQKNEISPENILPLSQHDIDNDDDDDLNMPQSAIQEFEEEETNPRDMPYDINPPTSEPKSEDSLEIDDDIFDDLLSTMDDVIDEQTEGSKDQDSA